MSIIIKPGKFCHHFVCLNPTVQFWYDALLNRILYACKQHSGFVHADSRWILLSNCAVNQIHAAHKYHEAKLDEEVKTIIKMDERYRK